MSVELDRRALSLGLLAASLSPALPAMAQSFPLGRMVRLVVPFPPGGATDVIGRIMADKIGQIWNQTIIVENKPGAGGNIGVSAVARSEPNGDTFLLASVGIVTNPFLYSKLTYDPANDFVPISLVAIVPNLLVVGNHLPFKSVADLIAYAKQNPGKLKYGSSGVGTSVHLCGELFQKMTGTVMTHVPYKGTAQATQDLIGGHIDLIFDNISQILPHVKAGNVRALGITTAKPSPVTPEFVPIAETVPGFDVTAWFALFAPAKVPPSILAIYSKDAQLAAQDPAVRQKLEGTGAIVVGSSPEELGRFTKQETQIWGDLIKSVGIKIE